MSIGELIGEIIALKDIDRIEIRKDEDGYWFADAVRHEGLDGHEQGYQYYAGYLEGALSGLFRTLKELD